MIKKLISKLTPGTWGIAGLLIAVLLCEVYFTTLIPTGRKAVFSALEHKSWSEFHSGILYYSYIFIVFGIAQGVKGFIGSTLSIRIREALTKVVLKNWVKQEDLTKHDHPSQRINEDIRICTEASIEIGLEVFISAFIVVILIAQMWETQALLLWAATGYTLLSLVVAWLFNRPLKVKDINLQVAEAAHREALHKIELGMGDFTAKEKLVRIVMEYMRYAKTKLMYSMFYKITLGMSSIIPFFFLVPELFKGQITLGQLMEGGSQFELVVMNLGILLSIYGSVVKAQAGWHRVIKFYKGQ